MHARKQILLGSALLAGVLWGASLARAGQVFTYVAEEAVFLRYAEEAGGLPDGYYVYRRQVGDTSWNRLTREPVEPIFSADQLRGAAGLSADVLISLLGGDEKTRRLSREDYDRVLLDPDRRNFLMMLTLGYPGLGRALGQEYVDTDMLPGTTFEYRITALRGGNESEVALSEPQTHGEPTQLPVPDSLLVVEEGDGEVYLDWVRDKARELKYGIVGYNLSRAQGDVSRPFVRVNATPVMDIAVTGGANDSRAFRDEGLVNGTRYWYRLSAVNVFGFEGWPGTPVPAVPRDRGAPPAVEDLGALITPGAVLLRWSPVIAADLRGYRVLRSVGGIDAFEQIAPTGGTAHSGTVFVDSLMVGEVLWYRVQAVDKAGNAGPFSDAVQVFEQDIIPPPRVTGLEAKATQAGRVDLLWAESSGRDLAGYRLQRSTLPSENEEAWMTLGDELQRTSFVDTLWRTQEGAVTYRVRAQDTSDNRGPWSDWVTVRPPDKLPPRPPFLKTVTVDGEAMRLTWARSPEPDLAGYFVWRSQQEGDGYKKLSREALADSVTTWEDTSPLQTAVNWYRLSAVDNDGNQSDLGNPMGTTFYDDVPPPIPNNLHAVSDTNGVTLVWTASKAGDLEGYRIYRQDSESTETIFYKNISASSIRFRDKQVALGQTYAYQIAAFDAASNFSERSDLILVIHDAGASKDE